MSYENSKTEGKTGTINKYQYSTCLTLTADKTMLPLPKNSKWDVMYIHTNNLPNKSWNGPYKGK